MKIDYKSLLIGAALGAALVLGIGAADNDTRRYEVTSPAHNAAFRTDIASGSVLYWNGFTWKDITPPK